MTASSGSSDVSGEGGADLEEDVVLVAEAVGYPLVTSMRLLMPFEQPGVERFACDKPGWCY